MMKSFDQLRVRLLQIRDNPSVEKEEQETFLERCRIASHQLIATNVLHEELPASLLDDVDALMIGGAGAHSAANDYPWMDGLSRLIFAACDRELPVFGSCWGHQYIARAFGGRVINDPTRAELGCTEVTLTKAGEVDELFRNFPRTFLANQGHHDRVAELPSNAIELASNDTAPFQAFKLKDLPVYGTQFHSELDARREHERLLAYRDYYPELDDEEVFNSVLKSLRETSEVDNLLHLFLETFALKPEE